MGVSALKGLQFFDRFLLLFLPLKFLPNYSFLKQVPRKKVQLFTLVQLVCLAVLWIFKSFRHTSIFLPIMLLVVMGVRKLLKFGFSQNDLRLLDDVLPDFSRKKRMEDDHAGDDRPTIDQDLTSF